MEAPRERSYRSLNIPQRGVIGGSRALNRVLESLPTGPWIRRRLRDGLEVTRHEIALSRGGPGLDGLTVAYLSDLHAGTFMDERDIESIFRLAAALEPDLVLFGGDLVEDRPEEALLYRRPLRLLDPPLGVFAVPGNHEYHRASTFRVFRGVLREAGVRLLLNEGCAVERAGSRLWIAGVEDEAGEATDVPASLEGRRADDPVLLLAHRPDTFLQASELSVDLTLSGHTHGGQVLIGGWTPFHHSRYGWWRGAHARNGCRLYVGRGIGAAALPLRIGSEAEIPLFRLRSPDQEVADAK